MQPSVGILQEQQPEIVLNDILQVSVAKSELKTQSLKPQGLSTSLGPKKMKCAFLKHNTRLSKPFYFIAKKDIDHQH